MNKRTFNVEPLTTPMVDENGGQVDMEIIRDEPMLFSSSLSFAMEQGGPLTQRALKLLNVHNMVEAELYDLRHSQDKGRFWVIDTRSHMLMPGQCPAIPGWHCDAWPRINGTGQPDMSTEDKAAVHYTVLFESEEDVAPTEFAVYEQDVPYQNGKVWGSIDEHLREHGTVGSHFAEAGRMYRFGYDRLHRATPATKRGWRWFFRCSSYARPPMNEIRKQTQVYVSPGVGW